MIETLKQFHQQWHSSYVGIDLSELIRLKLGVGKIHQAVIDLVGIDLSELIRLKQIHGPFSPPLFLRRD